MERTRAAEGYQMLRVLLQQQEQYRVENGSYLENDPWNATAQRLLGVTFQSTNNFSVECVHNNVNAVGHLGRSNGAYGLIINSAGRIRCVNGGGMCGTIGCNKGAGNECN